MAIFGFFKKVKRPIEILVGTVFIIPAIMLIANTLSTGVTEDMFMPSAICCLFTVFGAVILVPPNIKRDALIYFMVLLLAGIACFIVGFGQSNTDLSAVGFISGGVVCIMISIKYFLNIKNKR